MVRHRHSLPQATPPFFLTDGGIETTLIYHDGLELPDFAAFHLLRDDAGTEALRAYFRRYAAIAMRHGAGLVLESATWRASADWGRRLGYNAGALAAVNRRAIDLLEEIRAECVGSRIPVVISGCIGPRGDGYVPTHAMGVAEAERYHHAQVATFTTTAADMVTAITMNYEAEATGIALAARRAGMPVAVSFTVETDGRLPTGQSLADAIAAVDRATGAYPTYYMINCAHPEHFERMLADGREEYARIRGLRANASNRSHAELNAMTELDSGDPEALAAAYARLTEALPQLNIFGGCCGTDHRHVERIAEAVGSRQVAHERPRDSAGDGRGERPPASVERQ
jgi:S-methylmethionine-dependent homocysteine/selenocysteine methylase